MGFRHVIAVGFLGALLCVFGCDGCSEKPHAKAKPKAGPPVAEAAACSAKTCDKCVGEAGCWWCKTQKKCTLDKVPGCKDKDQVNELDQCQ